MTFELVRRPSMNSPLTPVAPVARPAVPLWAAWIPIVVLIGLLVVNVRIYGDAATYGPNQIALLIAAAVAVLVGLPLGIRFQQMLEGIKTSIHSALTAILILLLIGSLIGTWMISGIVPAMIYYGLQILDPKIFLCASVVVCSIVSVATGSSWSTVGTVGVALMGIGQALGVSPAMTGGAIISGAYFGDKISPLSDTTNLAAAMAGTDLITHVKYMLYTTVPSISITLLIFLAIGFSSEASAPIGQTQAMMSALDEKFNLTPVLFVVPLIVLGLVIAKVDAVAALFIGTILGGVFAVILQPTVITDVAGLTESDVRQTTNSTAEESNAPIATQAPSYLKRSYVALINAMANEVKIIPDAEVSLMQSNLQEQKLAAARTQTGNAELSWAQFEELNVVLTESFADRESELEGKVAAAGLMKGKGMNGMLATVWLIICAMCFGGVMEACGLLQRITNSLLSFANSTGSLVATTVGSCVFVNLTASDQYLSIVVPGRMFRETFEERGLAPQLLSRTLEDAGTVTSVLVPWNTCGAFQASTLGIATLVYLPFCFFNWISPLMTILFAVAGIKIARLPAAKNR